MCLVGVLLFGRSYGGLGGQCLLVFLLEVCVLKVSGYWFSNKKQVVGKDGMCCFLLVCSVVYEVDSCCFFGLEFGLKPLS